MDRDPKQFQQDSGEPSEETLTAARTIDEQAAAIRERARLLGLPWHEKPIEADPNAILLVEPETAVRLRVVPITLRDGHLVLAMFDPLDTESADEIAILCGREVERGGHGARHLCRTASSALRNNCIQDGRPARRPGR